MPTLLSYDASTPPANPPVADIVAFYLGGDTPHVWSISEIAATTTRYRLPIWTRSNPQPSLALPDSQAMLSQLYSIGAPPCLTALDLEGAVTDTYVTAYYGYLHGPGYSVSPYVERVNWPSTPKCDGIWLAYPGATQRPASVLACQFAADVATGQYDLSWWAPSATTLLWDTEKSNLVRKGTTDDMMYLLSATDGAVFLLYAGRAVGLTDSVEVQDFVAKSGAKVVTGLSPADLQAIVRPFL